MEIRYRRRPAPSLWARGSDTHLLARHCYPGARDQIIGAIEAKVEKVRVDPDSLLDFATALFVQAGLSTEHAATIARVQLEADLRGMHSHGMRAVPTYLDRIRRGIINPRPKLTVTDLGIGVLVDGDAGPGQVVASRAMEECLLRARRQRVGLGFVLNSNHFGAAGYYAEMALAEDMIGFATTNGNLVLAFWNDTATT